MKTLREKAAEYRMSASSFKFYVPAPYEQQDLNSKNDIFEEKSAPILHQGEVVIAKGLRVLLFPHVAEKGKGLSGTIYVSNFRLIFTAYEEEGNNKEESLHQRNLLFGEYSVCLTNIESLYQLTGDKKRKILSDSVITGKVKWLQVVCKNMKVLTFNFDQSPIDHGKNVTKTLLHHAFPGRHPLLFAYEYKKGEVPPNKFTEEVVMFNDVRDWEGELTRTCSSLASKWRVSRQNRDFQMSSSLPKWLIIPQSVFDYDLTSVSGSFRCNRPPIWTWSSPTGAALIRMADLLPTITDRTQENRMLENIRKCHPQLKGPSIKYLDKDLPSIRDLFTSYSKLRDLCIPDNSRQFKIQDSRLYSSLDNTKWLHYVSSCLRIAVDAAKEILNDTTVVLQESDGRDTSAVVSSLVQLMLDPHTRSICGFQSLIQKEWVALGHPFCKRLGHVKTDESEQSPVFLLFLDCVWQLQYQYSSAFEFTETYLTTLWDSAHISVFDTFLFDCEKDRLAAINSKNEPIIPRTIWNWDEQFSSNDVQLFVNPLYKFSELRDLANLELYGSTKKTFGKPKSELIVIPKYHIAFVEVWTQCYFRWLPFLSIKSGGLPQIDVVHRLLVSDIKSLLCSVNELSKKHFDNGIYSNKLPKLSRLKLTDFGDCESNSQVEVASTLFEKRKILDNFFPFSFDCTSYLSSGLTNSSHLSEFDSQSILNVTE